MAATLGEVSVTLLMNMGSFLSGSKTAQANISAIEKQGITASQKLTTGFSSMFKTVGGGLVVFGALKKGLVDSIAKFYEAKDSSDRLTASLDGNIEKAREFEQIAGRIQSMTIYGDELVQDGFTFLAGQERTEAQMKKTMDAAVDYAAFMKKDLMTAVKELSMTYDGNLGRLTRIDGRLKDLTPEQLRNGAAVDLLAEKYKGWGEIIGNTTEGKIKRFQNAMEEMQEGIGAGFMEGLAQEFDSLSNSILGASTNAKDMGVYIGKTIGYVLQLVTGVKLLTTVLGIVSNAVNQVKSRIVELIRTKEDFVNKAANIPIIGTWFQFITDKANHYLNVLRQIVGAQKQMSEGKAIFEGKHIGNAKDPMNDPANDSKRSNPSTNTGKTQQLQEEIKQLDRIEQLQEDIKKLEAERLELIKKYDVNSNFIKEHTAKIRELKQELKELLAVEQERAREYEKNSRADGTREMADGTSRPGARPEPAVMGEEEDWLKRIGYATAIFNILNKRPDNPFQIFLMILGIAQQIALLMNAGPLGGVLGAFTGLLGAFGGIFGFAGGGRLSEGRIKGPGTSTSDSILARAGNRMIRLSNDEYIVPAWMNFLYPMLDEIRNGGIATRSSFASGGRLSGGSGSAFYGTLNIYEDAVVSETFSRRVVATGFPLWQIQKKKRGSRK
jgi:hypothetical protein